MQAAAKHLVRAIDQIQQLIGSLGADASTLAMMASFREEETIATDTADWIETQPLRIQDHATIAAAHDHFRSVALHVQAIVDGLLSGDSSSSDAKAAGTEIANLIFMRPDLEALE